jgi:hypothetical protein
LGYNPLKNGNGMKTIGYGLFGKTLLFADEESVPSFICDTQERSIVVGCENEHRELADMDIATQWLHISGERVRYLSQIPFREYEGQTAWGMEIEKTLLLQWNPLSSEILYRRLCAFSGEKLLFWVLHTFLPIILEMDGEMNILHSAAVESRKRAILFIAPPFGGKSTITDHFVSNGYRLVGDDSTGLRIRDGRYFAIPSYPYRRPYRRAGDLGIFTENFTDSPTELSAIFHLRKSPAQAKMTIEEIKGIEKFDILQNACFIDLPFRRVERVKFFSDMARRVTLYELTLPADRKRLPEARERISSLLS